jgi:mannosyl-glycoprotein endo-beta-N-acetylglucosaminidase
MLDIQMSVSPQTDTYGGGWQNAKIEDVAFHLNPTNFLQFTPVINSSNQRLLRVTTDILNVRSGPGTSHGILTTVSRNQVYTVLNSSNGWYQINVEGITGWISGEYAIIVAEIGQPQIMPTTAWTIQREMYQFMILSGSSGITASNLNAELTGKGILAGRGQAFIDAGRNNNINEIYLLAHALLETGHGTSALATGVLVSTVDGVPVEPRVTYNIYGIGAKDEAPVRLGSEYAYKQGWFTPEAAIIGGAKWIADGYVNNATHKQDTLYKMRWNPSNAGRHQYATDIGWALKQTRSMQLMLDICLRYSVQIRFDIPIYK